MDDKLADEVVKFLGSEPYSLDMETGFDPADPDTWPARMAEEDAKQAIFSDCGGDLAEAKAIWAQHFGSSLLVDRVHLLRVMRARAMTSDIVDQLRGYDVMCYSCTEWNPPCYSPETCECVCHKGIPAVAADEIERLRAELESVREQLWEADRDYE